MIRAIAILILVLTFGVTRTPATELCPELTGWLAYGAVEASLASNELLYFGSGGSLMIADISDPSSPRIVGQAFLGYSRVTAIGLNGGNAYVTTLGGGGLRVVDVTPPGQAKEIGFFNPSHLSGYDLEVIGNKAYAAMGTSFRIFDVSTPSNPVELSVVRGDPGTTGTIFRGITVRDDLAYLTTSVDLRIFDVSAPAAPVELSRFSTPRSTYDIDISGDFAFVADHHDGMWVINIADPNTPFEAGRFSSPGHGRRVTVAEGHAYLSEDPTFPPESPIGVRILDVRSPEAPLEVAFVETGSTVANVEVNGSIAYLSTGYSGLRILDVADPGAPKEIAVHDPVNRARNVDAHSGIAAVVTEYEGLRIIDYSDPSSPEEIAHLDSTDRVWGATISGDLAYLADLDGNLRIIDLSSPSAPREIGRLARESDVGTAYEVGIADNIAYLIHSRGLKVVDVSRPDSPIGIGSCLTPRSPTGIAISEGFAYLSDFYWSLRVIDVRAPQTPFEVADLEMPSEALAVAVDGTHAYVGTEWTGLRIIDVSDPAHPVEVGFLDGHHFDDVTVRSGLAFVAASGNGLWIVDVRNPAQPKLIDVFDTPGSCVDVSLDEDLTIVADYTGGIEVFDISSCGPRLDQPRRTSGRVRP